MKAAPGHLEHDAAGPDDRELAQENLRHYRNRLERLLRTRTEQLLKTQKQLNHAERMTAVGTMAAGLAHDLANLLVPLTVCTQAMLQSPTLSDDDRANLAVINSLLDHLRQMGRNLALFVRDPARPGIEGSTDIARWCQQVERLLEVSVGPPGSGLALQWQCAPDLPPVAIAPHRLTQVIQNLVFNARDAILEAKKQFADDTYPGRIEIRVHTAGDGRAVIIQVKDNGIGMSNHVKLHCGEPDFTSKDCGPSLSLGTGIGLALVKSVIQHVGGRIDIDAGPVGRSQGTTITLTLPIAVARPDDRQS